LKLDLLACVVDVNASKISIGIIVHDNPFGNFSALDTRLFGEVDCVFQGIPDTRFRRSRTAFQLMPDTVSG
jgi:hypothetical protein